MITVSRHAHSILDQLLDPDKSTPIAILIHEDDDNCIKLQCYEAQVRHRLTLDNYIARDIPRPDDVRFAGVSPYSSFRSFPLAAARHRKLLELSWS